MSKKRGQIPLTEPRIEPRTDIVSSSLEELARHQADDRSYGGAYRDRTDDPLLAKQVLSQLS